MAQVSTETNLSPADIKQQLKYILKDAPQGHYVQFELGDRTVSVEREKNGYSIRISEGALDGSRNTKIFQYDLNGNFSGSKAFQTKPCDKDVAPPLEKEGIATIVQIRNRKGTVNQIQYMAGTLVPCEKH